MKIHEYQGKQILAKYGVPVPRGMPCFSVDEAVAAAREVVELTRQAAGDDSVELAVPLGNLATAQYRAGDLAGDRAEGSFSSTKK